MWCNVTFRDAYVKMRPPMKGVIRPHKLQYFTVFMFGTLRLVYIASEPSPREKFKSLAADHESSILVGPTYILTYIAH